MEHYVLNENINVLCVPATTFPDGVQAAHQKLHAIFPFGSERRFFGLSRPGPDKEIHYMAAAEKKEEKDADLLGLEEFVIQEGEYYCVTIKDFMKDIPAIGRAFADILQQKDIDAVGICIEWYFNATDVRCMVRRQVTASS
jgi:predicted transcriptional regulator YdeE